MKQSLYPSTAAYQPTEAQMAEPVPPVAAVLFDFSNTLFSMVDLETWLRRVWAAAGRDGEPGPDVLSAAVAQLAETYTIPEVAEAQAGRDLSPERHRDAMHAWWRHVDFLRDIEPTAYDVLRAPDTWVPYADTGPVLRALRDAGMRVGVVSDIAWDIAVHFKHFDLDQYVDAYVVSSDHGCEKPDPALFRVACERLDADPRAALMVGDNPARDGGAAALGMRAYILPGEPRTGERGLAHVLGFLSQR
jgi:HAD superfamily hydrolase (TIGR01549 family)